MVPDSAAAIDAWTDETREGFHALSRMLEQLQDLTARQILRGTFVLLNENPGEMSAKTLYRRAAKLGALPDEDDWLRLASIRNTLTHDYPTNPERQIVQVQRAYGVVDELTATVEYVLAFIERERLLDDV